MLHKLILTLLACEGLLSGAVVVDRIAVVVGKRVIKTSDIDRDLRVSSFLNRQPLDESPAARRKAAERLVDQELVRQDILNGQYSQPTAQDASNFLEQLKHDRFAGSDPQIRADLTRYRLTEDQLRRHLLWQLTVLRFIDQRFRPSVLVTDEEIAAYYRDHQAELQKAYPRGNRLEDLQPKIRETITGERVNQVFDDWLAETRRSTRIEYREQAFAEGTSQ